jgi:hypothetical protein
MQFFKLFSILFICIISLAGCASSEKFKACVTDWKDTRICVKQIIPVRDKPLTFFKVKQGDAVLEIPLSDIARIIVTDKEKSLCTIVLKDRRTFFKSNQDGCSWTGENEFGGNFFIEWKDWRKVEFLR